MRVRVGVLAAGWWVCKRLHVGVEGAVGWPGTGEVHAQHTQRHLPPALPRRSEWTNLFEFIQAKQLRVENFKEAQRGPGAAAITSYADVDDVDAGQQGAGRGAARPGGGVGALGPARSACWSRAGAELGGWS